MRKLLPIILTAAIVGLAVHAYHVRPAPWLGMHAQPRSPEWPKVRAQHLVRFPACEVCGTTAGVEVHHVKPFHEYPALELDEANLITLCDSPSCKSHLTLGHLGNYLQSNPHVRDDAALLKKRRADAQRAQQ